ncbi:MAG: hypothetical protein RBU37_07705 [Myxococcota bacterium]|nr:hypothetical protein [Myxococcota bacterium]
MAWVLGCNTEGPASAATAEQHVAEAAAPQLDLARYLGLLGGTPEQLCAALFVAPKDCLAPEALGSRPALLKRSANSDGFRGEAIFDQRGRVVEVVLSLESKEASTLRALRHRVEDQLGRSQRLVQQFDLQFRAEHGAASFSASAERVAPSALTLDYLASPSWSVRWQGRSSTTLETATEIALLGRTREQSLAVLEALELAWVSRITGEQELLMLRSKEEPEQSQQAQDAVRRGPRASGRLVLQDQRAVELVLHERDLDAEAVQSRIAGLQSLFSDATSFSRSRSLHWSTAVGEVVLTLFVRKDKTRPEAQQLREGLRITLSTTPPSDASSSSSWTSLSF